MKPVLEYYKLDPSAVTPQRATEHAACWDISACFHTDTVKTSDGDIPLSGNKDGKYIIIWPGQRCLIPTGLIFKIPPEYSLRIHPRSGLAWKNGITVQNCEGVVDADYYDETFVMLINHSTNNFVLKDQTRIAQIELAPVIEMMVYNIGVRPAQTTSRQGGFGSTGTDGYVHPDSFGGSDF